MARPSFLSRLVALTVVWLLATAALTFAASKRMVSSAAKPLKSPVTPQVRKTLVVPDVRKQAYVFAKGILGDGGFAWKVQGAVDGYAANTVATQSPLPGTRVVDTGAPTIVLRLAHGGRQTGTPENAAPFPGTAIQLADVAVNRLQVPRTALSSPKRPVAKPKAVAKAAPKAKPAAKPVAKPAARKPLFVVPGAKPEPANEISLPARADRLLAWLDGKPAPTNANVTHWMYQHQWIVTGARMGWYGGDDALRTLLLADQKVWNLWGVGARSADLARRTLSEVEARTS